MGKKKPSQKTAQHRQKKSKHDKAGAIARTIATKQKQEKFKKEFIDKINAERMEDLEKRKQEIMDTQEVLEGEAIGDIGEFVLDDEMPPKTEPVAVSNEEVVADLQEFKLD